MVRRRRPLPPKICAQNYPPPSEMRRLRPISAYNISTVRASKKTSTITNRKSATRFPTSFRWSPYVTPKSPPKGGSKSKFVIFVNKNQFKSNKLWYKISLWENFQRQSCSRTISLSNRFPYISVIDEASDFKFVMQLQFAMLRPIMKSH